MKVLFQLGQMAANGFSKHTGGENVKKMSSRAEANVSLIAALLVLFSAMLDPRVSAGLAVVVLIGMAVYHYRTA